MIWFVLWTSQIIGVLIRAWSNFGAIDGTIFFFRLMWVSLWWEYFKALNYPSIATTVGLILNVGYYATWIFTLVALLIYRIRRR